MTQSGHHLYTHGSLAVQRTRRCQPTAGCGKISAGRTASAARGARETLFAEFSSGPGAGADR
jgi:hypothetical protein